MEGLQACGWNALTLCIVLFARIDAAQFSLLDWTVDGLTVYGILIAELLL
jgi:hypothetical protein